MKKFDNAARARIAVGWDGSGMDQAAYARLHGIRPRTLRLWREQFLTVPITWEADAPPGGGAGGAVDALRARLAALDAALDAARTAVAAFRASLDAAAACRPMPNEGGIDEPVDAAEVEVQDAGGMPDLAPGEVENLPSSKPHGRRVARLDAPSSPRRTLLDDIAAAVQAAVAGCDGVADAEGEHVAVRPGVLLNPRGSERRPVELSASTAPALDVSEETSGPPPRRRGRSFFDEF